MIHAGRKSRPYGLACRVKGSHPVSTSYERSDGAGGIADSHPVYLGGTVNRLGTWKVRGINDTTKKEEVEDVIKKGKFELLP